MAETIVHLVLGKLADVVVQEAFFLYGVRDKIERVQRDLKWIQSFLKDADTKRHKDETVKQWVKEVQDVGYLIEDAIEKFLMEVGGGRTEGLQNVLKRIGKMPMKLMKKHKLGNQLDKIQQRLREIRENRAIYGVEGLQASGGASVEQPIRPIVNPDIDETEVVGFLVDKKTIADQLIDTNNMRRAVISIVGYGGSGKTTLAKEVYKRVEVKRHFDISMWLTISQEYKLMDILIKMLEKIRNVLDSERQNKDEEYFITELNKSMKERKYLVVLDDVWPSNNVWTVLQAALPDANNGSRVLITTRFINVAEEIDRISKPHVIQPLNEEESKQLLMKKIFPNQFANECPNDLLPLATEFTKKCHGWPLPLVVLGGILSRKNPDYHTWNDVMQKMDWQTDGSRFMGVISTSYEDLPTALKPCFMYFCVFPEDYQIKATTLIRLWIAEGFIRQEGTKILEDTADDYLEELVQRCMVQVSKRSWIGKIEYCHIHDLLRDLAIQKAKDDNFLTVISKNDTMLSCSTCARRVALRDCEADKMIEPACKKNIRSMINFHNEHLWYEVRNFKGFRTLRVLHYDQLLYSIPLHETNNLKGLKYIACEKFSFSGHTRCSKLPTRVHFWGTFFKRSPLTYMKNLQTVSTFFCKSHGELPLSFWSNKQLRNINFVSCLGCLVVPEGPPSAADLQSLLTLGEVRARQDWVAQLPNFPNIRELAIFIPEDVAEEPLINLLSKLNHLGSLFLEMDNKRQTLVPFLCCISAFKTHNGLYSFGLKYCKWPRNEVGDCTMFPPHLVQLILLEITFEEDPMPQLEKLPNLRKLDLWGKIEAAGRKRMICSRGGFGGLHLLELYVDDLEEWKIEEGAMPMLNQLTLGRCRKLQIVPDLQYLAKLQEFTTSFSCSDEFKSKLQGEDQWKIKHIPSVKIR